MMRAEYLRHVHADGAKDTRPVGVIVVTLTNRTSSKRVGERELPEMPLSGGCLEGDLSARAREVLENDVPRVVEYDMRSPNDVLFGTGAGCAGAMLVLLEPVGSDSRAEQVLGQFFATSLSGRPPLIFTIYESHQWSLGTYTEAELPPLFAITAERRLLGSYSRNIVVECDGGFTLALAQSLAPAPRLLICGGGPDAEPVSNMAITLGWQVCVLDHRPAYAIERRFPGADVRLIEWRATADLPETASCDAAVIMSHHLPSDAKYLRALVDANGPRYIGLLGPTARRNRVVQESGVGVEALGSKLHGPIGLDIGALTPESIALAIVSEIHAWLAGREGLRHKE